MRVKTQNSSLVPFVAAAEAGGFAVVVDIFLKLFEMKPVWKFASSCGGFIMYTGVYTKILRNKNGRRCAEKTREKKVKVSSRKFFFGGALAFLAAGEKIFPLFWFTTFEKKRATRQPRTRVQEAPDTLFSLLCRKEKEVHTKTPLSLVSSVKIVLTVRCLFGLGRTTTRTKTKRKTLKKKKRRRRRR